MKCALIALSSHEAQLALALAQKLPNADVFVHNRILCAIKPQPKGVVDGETGRHGDEGKQLLPKRVAKKSLRHAKILRAPKPFRSVLALTTEIFSRYHGLIYIAPCGVAVRAIAAHVKNKLADPAVVVVDAGGRFAISLLSGHEGGANDLALTISNILSAEPIISTTSEALKTVIAGVGCRRGTSARQIIIALKSALKEAAVALSEVRLLASADIKSNEAGLIEAARRLKLPLRFISSAELRNTCRIFRCSEFVKTKVNLPAVAEPAALLAGRRTQLILPKRVYPGVTVALARESCLWSASDPAAALTALTAPKKRSRKAR
ncbi:MAG: cobalamin biosynthesis protein [Planctomycetota bacterium]